MSKAESSRAKLLALQSRETELEDDVTKKEEELRTYVCRRSRLCPCPSPFMFSSKRNARTLTDTPCSLCLCALSRTKVQLRSLTKKLEKANIDLEQLREELEVQRSKARSKITEAEEQCVFQKNWGDKKPRVMPMTPPHLASTLPTAKPRLAKASDAAQDTTTLNKRIEALTAEVSELKTSRMQLQEGERRSGRVFQTAQSIFFSAFLDSAPHLYFSTLQNTTRLMIAAWSSRAR